MPRLAIVPHIASRLTVSVALCTYNGSRFIGEQLRSILAQSPPPDQLVISDDGSTDGTLDAVRAELAAQPAAIRSGLEVVILENASALGVTRNFESAVRACTGEIIALSDQDDVWMPERLARARAEFTARPELLLLHGDARLVDDDGAPIGHTLFEAIEFTPEEQREVRDGNALGVLVRRNVATGATVVFRRGLLNHAIPFSDVWVHDEWLAIIASIMGRVDFESEPLIDYRQHNANQIGATKPTLRIKIGRLREPRDERNQHLVGRAEALLGRVIGLGDAAPPGAVEFITKKLEHERFRRDLPVTPLFRVVPVLREMSAGGYRRFGRARYDVLRDLVQPDI
jgi:glycosyltransferase involved in cell wall biosynthesis